MSLNSTKCGKVFFVKFSTSNSVMLTLLVIQGAPKKPSPYIVMFVLLQHLFRCTNNIPCELKFCFAHTEAQTKFVCQKLV